jgi:hypothetical protein
MISSRDLTALPKIEELKEFTQSLAMFDAIIMREWVYRYYSFNCKWAEGEQMASMRNGEGDGWYCCFGFPGGFLKGFDHESEMSPWSMETHRVGRACWMMFRKNLNPWRLNLRFQWKIQPSAFGGAYKTLNGALEESPMWFLSVRGFSDNPAHQRPIVSAPDRILIGVRMQTQCPGHAMRFWKIVADLERTMGIS